MGTDIKNVIANASFIFDEFKKILLENKNNNGTTEEAIKKMCADHKILYHLWDGEFFMACMVDQSHNNIDLYKRTMFAALHCHIQIGCNMTHKVYLIWHHIVNQMKYVLVLGGLGEKMDDWLERQHQDGKRYQDIYRRVVDVQVNADRCARREHHSSRSEVKAQKTQVCSNASRNLTKVEDKSVKMKQKRERLANQKAALEQFERPLLIIVKFMRCWEDCKDNIKLLWGMMET